ncbi:MAG: hypothetical protein K8F34_07110 [Candidatus Kuenenia stuttgartiensis]|nr:hypothetical protein [Candidatus Kuenenia stuttgartiensis]GJQ48155.1 MAG: hypothetical protein HKUEN01_05410 [Candidatus Kuenenia stuttgartiensis]
MVLSDSANVGLPLVIEFCKAGFQVTGFDIGPEKVKLLSQGKSYIKHIDSFRITDTGFYLCIPYSLQKKQSVGINSNVETGFKPIFTALVFLKILTLAMFAA